MSRMSQPIKAHFINVSHESTYAYGVSGNPHQTLWACISVNTCGNYAQAQQIFA